MANTKIYQLVINGLTESISAVDSLNKQLDNLEQRINDLQGKGVNVSGGGTSLPKASELSEIEKIEREIAKVQEKQAAHQSEEYKALLMEKEALKQIESQAKASAKALAGASNPNEIDLNTMSGIKQRMRDLKLQHNNTDINSDLFKEQTREINELNQKLKELEAEYGVYSRNVGNYANGVAEGYKSARAELKALKTEMQNLTVKQDRGIISEEEAERLKSLIPTVKQLESSIADAGKPMDSLMDAMQSIVAIAQTTKGLSALFGLDDDKIERSIQKLVALQNVMQGLQKLQEQMNTGEGIGKIFTSLDNFAVKAQTGTKAMQGLGKAAAFTSTALKGLSKAFGWIGLAMTAFDVIKDFFNDTEKEAPKAIGRIQELSETMTQMKNSYIDAQTSSLNLASRLTHLQTAYKTTNDELKKTSILKEAAKEFKNLGIQVNSLNDAQNILVEKGDDVINMIREQGKVAAISALRMEAFTKSFKMLMENGYDVEGASILAGQNSLVRQFDAIIDKSNEKIAEYQKNLKIGDTSKKVKENSNKTLDAVKIAQENINELTLKLMSDGLYKELKKLDENNRKEIDKIKKNGEKVEEQLKLQYKVYEKEQNELFDKYINDIEKRNVSLSLQNEIDQVKLLREEWDAIHITMNRPTSIKDAPLFGSTNSPDNIEKLIEQYKSWTELYDIRNDELSKNNWKGYFEALKKDYLPKAAKEIQDEFYRLLEVQRPDSFDGLVEGDLLVTGKNQKEAYKYLREEFEKETSELKYFLTKYQGTIKIGENEISQILEDSYLERVSLTTERLKNMIEVVNGFINESLRLEKEKIDGEEKLEKEANEKRLKNAREGYEKLISESKKYSGYTPLSVAELLRGKEENGLSDEEKSLQKFVKLIDEYEKEATQITLKYTTQRKNAELDTTIQRQNNNYKYYEQTITNFEDYIQKASNILDKQPEVNEFGFINLKKTREQYNEVIDMYKHMASDIKATATELITDFSTNKIRGEQFDAAINNLEFYKKKVEENLEDINEKIKQHKIELFSSINDWLQQLGQATSSILSSLSEITSNGYEKQIDEQQAFIDKYEELLQKQEDITQKHADRINSIEDELANARGDRRQHLIDQLNAEIQAQRESLKEEEAARKKKEAAERKQADLEYKQALARKNMDAAQAAINAAMAISMAAVNHWPIPAIPLMALATAVGAAQVAAVKSQYIPKPKYADGGVIQGKSHKQGGVKVLGGTAEVEGGEFITNKITTTKNVELLEYINSNKKRIDLSDMIEFFNDKPRATIKSIRSKFENGGTLPNIDLTRGGENTIYIKDETPVVVQVVDIMNKADEVRAVRTIAGAN